VVNISRGQRSRYTDDPAWQQVPKARADRAVEDNAVTFGDRVAGLRPDVVVDPASRPSCRHQHVPRTSSSS
jgi:hypothetical protein